MDSLPPFLRFTPVPLKPRRDGWTPLLQWRFILALARGAGPGEAARALGKSRQTAYALRDKPGAGSFAKAWDAASAFAQLARAAGRAPLPDNGGPGEAMLVPRYYRGRLVGYVQREDYRGALRTLGRLDRMADRLERDGADAALRQASERFEAYLRSLKTDKDDGNRL